MCNDSLDNDSTQHNILINIYFNVNSCISIIHFDMDIHYREVLKTVLPSFGDNGFSYISHFCVLSFQRLHINLIMLTMMLELLN